MKRFRIILLGAALFAFAATAGEASASGGRTISVSGIGIVTIVPDQAQFTFGVSTTARTARAALAANSVRMNKVIAAIKALGVAARDIQTAEISLSPNMNDAETKILSFTAGNSVSATTKQIAMAGSIVDAAVSAGANEIGGPTLGLSDQPLLTRTALKAAVADARTRALTIAAAAHIKLGKVLSVIESSPSQPVTSSGVAKASADSTPVEAGTVQIEEVVSVTFAIA